jgi:hypothetical protein
MAGIAYCEILWKTFAAARGVLYIPKTETRDAMQTMYVLHMVPQGVKAGPMGDPAEVAVVPSKAPSGPPPVRRV